MATPRVHFCWLCGHRLRGNSHVEREVDGHVRILHLKCADSLDAEEAGPPTSAFGDEDDFLSDTDYLEDYRDDDE